MSQELFIASGSRRDYLSGIMLLTTVGLGITAFYFWSKLDSFKNFFEQERASADEKIKKLEETIEKKDKTQESLQNELNSEKSKNAELQKKIDKFQFEKINNLELKVQSLETKFEEAKKVITPVEHVKTKQAQLRGRSSSMGSSASFYKSNLPKIPEKKASPEKIKAEKKDNTRLKRSASLSSSTPAMLSGKLTPEYEKMRLSSVVSPARFNAINKTKQYMDLHGESTEAMEILEELLCGHSNLFSQTYSKIVKKYSSTMSDLLSEIKFSSEAKDDNIPNWRGMREGTAKERIAAVIKNNLYLKVNERTKQFFGLDDVKPNLTSENRASSSLRKSQ